MKIRIVIRLVLILILIEGCASFQTTKNEYLFNRYMKKGQECIDRKEHVEALEQYKLALSIDPDNREVRSQVKQLEREIYLYANKHYRTGLLYRNKGKHDLARSEFIKVLQYQPNHSGALKELKRREESLSGDYLIHTIEQGETLSSLSKMYYGSYEKYPIIAECNNISDVANVRVGQRIKVPTLATKTHTPSEKSTSFMKSFFDFFSNMNPWGESNKEEPEKEEPEVDSRDEKFIVHTIKQGETLSSLAKMYYGSYEKYYIIAEYNSIPDATQVKVGQKVKVPGLEFAPPSVSVLPSYKQTDEKENAIQEETQAATVDEGASSRNLGIELYEKKEYQDAIVEFAYALDVNPSDEISVEYLYKSHLQYGVDLFEKKKYLEAKTNFETSLEYNEQCRECREYIKNIGNDKVASAKDVGAESFKKRQFKQAIDTFTEILNTKPDDEISIEYLYKSHFQYGVDLFEKREFQQAKNHFEESLGYNEHCQQCREYIKIVRDMKIEAKKDIGAEFFKTKKYNQAIDTFTEILNTNPDDEISIEYLYKSHFQYGVDLFEKKKYLEAKYNFEASLRYNEQCLKCREYIKRSRETYLGTHYDKGLAYFGKQQLSAAIREWELVREVDPNYKEVKNNIEKAKTLLDRLESIKKSMEN